MSIAVAATIMVFSPMFGFALAYFAPGEINIGWMVWLPVTVNAVALGCILMGLDDNYTHNSQIEKEPEE